MLGQTVTTKTTHSISGIKMDSVLLTGIGIGMCLGIVISMVIALIVY
jgi:hypothetical protein